MRERCVGRFSVVALTLVAWFVISNHCALAILEKPQRAALQAACHGGATKHPSSPARDEQTPCCKTLAATLPKPQSLVGAACPVLSVESHADVVALSEQYDSVLSCELDTGPPFSGSFAEIVLQRSILAHAPPFLA